MIEGFSSLIVLLINLIKKDTTFKFNKKYKKSFKLLKERIYSEPILVIFNLEKGFILKIDASDKVIEAALL